MALLGFEGFDHLTGGTGVGPSLGIMPNWVSAGSVAGSGLVAGLLGGFAIVSASMSYTFSPGGSYATLIVGDRVKLPSTFAATVDLIRFMDGASVQCGVSVNTAGKLIFWRGTNATVIDTGATVLAISTTCLIELSVTFSTSGNSNGSYELRLDEVTEISASGTVDNTTTANASATGALILGGSNTAHDDFYLCDNSGGSPTNTFLGAVRVETLYVTSDNSVTWTPLSSTNASNVDETAMDSDTTYNSSGSTGEVDTFNHGSLSSTPSTIHAVDIVAGMRKDDVTVQTVRTKLISGGTTSNGSSSLPSTGYAWYRDRYLTDPDNGAWTASAVNATKIGYEHV